jgi:hypothetical protein
MTSTTSSTVSTTTAAAGPSVVRGARWSRRLVPVAVAGGAGLHLLTSVSPMAGAVVGGAAAAVVLAAGGRGGPA